MRIREESKRDLHPDALEMISVVLEKTQRPGTLKNCSYNAFTLRDKTFYHKCSFYIEVYAPLMAVNLTRYDLRIYDKPKKNVSKTDVTLKTESNSYINLHENIKAKLFIAKDGYHQSPAFSF